METTVVETNEEPSVSIQASEEAVGLAGGAGPRACPRPSNARGRHRRSSSFHRWMQQMQKAWTRVPSSRETSSRSSFNPEVLVNQKRLWYQLHSRSMEHKRSKEPVSLFEQFFIVGLHVDGDVEAIEDGFAKRRLWELEMERSDILDLKRLQHRAPPPPTSEPQILFKYPAKKRTAMRAKDLPAFCFPSGVKTRSFERTPSMSELNELVYGQEHLCRDDLSFIFSLKVADDSTLYGICLHVQEIVQRAPGILGVISNMGVASPNSPSSGRSSRFLVSAPRCYCILTKVPFFELHYEMLNSIIAEERLERITQFVSEMTLTDYIVPVVRTQDQLDELTQDQMDENLDSPNKVGSSDWTASAIAVDGALGLNGASAGPISDNEIPSQSLRQFEPPSPESISTSEASYFSQARELDKDAGKSLRYYDEYYASENSGSRSDSFERMNGSYENGQTSPEVGAFHFSGSHMLERVASSDSLYSSARSMGSEDEDNDGISSKHEKAPADEKIMQWAKEHNNNLLQIVCGYHALHLPPPGGEVVFQPLDHLQPIKYSRPEPSALGISRVDSGGSGCCLEAAEVNAKLAAAEEALALSVWTTATVCRALSLESVLALFAGALLEKQVIVICPNLGILSATILSVIPMIRPFEWQSLMLPILPRKMLDFLDAPVPFIVGLPNKPADLKLKTSNLVHINAHTDEVKASLPQLPRHRELFAELGPIHARLSCENIVAKRHPVYKCNEVQAEAAQQFLRVMRNYLESLCSNLRTHTITSVQSNNDKVSLLLKDSFIDSFPSRDQPFMKLFIETQLFSVLSDSRLSSYENE